MRRKFLSSSSRGEEKPAMTSSEGGGRRLRTTRLLDTSAPSSEPRPSSTCPLSSSRHFSNSKRVAVIFSNLWFHQGPHVSNFYSNVYPPSLANGGNFADIFYYICKKKNSRFFTKQVFLLLHCTQRFLTKICMGWDPDPAKMVRIRPLKW